MGCVFWPIAQCANFKLVPTRYKPLYVAVAGFFWTNIVCYIKSRDMNGKNGYVLVINNDVMLFSDKKPQTPLEQNVQI